MQISTDIMILWKISRTRLSEYKVILEYKEFVWVRSMGVCHWAVFLNHDVWIFGLETSFSWSIISVGLEVETKRRAWEGEADPSRGDTSASWVLGPGGRGLEPGVSPTRNGRGPYSLLKIVTWVLKVSAQASRAGQSPPFSSPFLLF